MKIMANKMKSYLKRERPCYTVIENLKGSFKCGKCERYNSDVPVEMSIVGGCGDDGGYCEPRIIAKCWSCEAQNNGV